MPGWKSGDSKCMHKRLSPFWVGLGESMKFSTLFSVTGKTGQLLVENALLPFCLLLVEGLSPVLRLTRPWAAFCSSPLGWPSSESSLLPPFTTLLEQLLVFTRCLALSPNYLHLFISNFKDKVCSLCHVLHCPPNHSVAPLSMRYLWPWQPMAVFPWSTDWSSILSVLWGKSSKVKEV